MPDTSVLGGSVLNLRIAAQNFGTASHSSDVTWWLASDHSTTGTATTTTLALSDMDSLLFGTWTAPLSGGIYTLEFFTQLPGDASLSNDTTKVIVTVEQVYSPTYIQDFDGAYLPDNWYEAFGNPLPPGSSVWTQSDEFANDGVSSPGVKMNVYGTDNDWLVSPAIDLAAFACELSYKVAATEYNNNNPVTMASVDTVFVLVSTDAGATWNRNQRITFYTSTNSPSNSGDSETFNLSAYSGIVRFAFLTIGTGTNPDMDIHFDDFQVKKIIGDDFGTLSHADNNASMPDTFIVIGDAIHPRIVAKNFGTTTHSSNVTWRRADDHGTTDTATTGTLATGESETVSFETWTPSTAGTYMLEFFTQLPGDADFSNDTTRVEIVVMPVDQIQVGYGRRDQIDGFP